MRLYSAFLTDKDTFFFQGQLPYVPEIVYFCTDFFRYNTCLINHPYYYP